MTVQVITDALGRKITVRELGPEDMLDLYECMGGGASSNAGFVNLAFMVWSVDDIDGVPSIPATKKEHLRARAKVLGNAGMIAVKRIMFPEPEDAVPAIEAPAPIEHAPDAQPSP